MRHFRFLIGGVASAVCAPDEWIMPNGAVEGDVLVLTKPLGTQPAVNAHEWLAMESKAERTAQLASAGVTPEDIESAYALAEQSMSSLNRTAARLMHTHGAHGATDVTGFGLLGHARNLALCQKEAVSFRIHTFPVIHHMCLVDKARKIDREREEKKKQKKQTNKQTKRDRVCNCCMYVDCVVFVARRIQRGDEWRTFGAFAVAQCGRCLHW